MVPVDATLGDCCNRESGKLFPKKANKNAFQPSLWIRFFWGEIGQGLCHWLFGCRKKNSVRYSTGGWRVRKFVCYVPLCVPLVAAGSLLLVLYVTCTLLSQINPVLAKVCWRPIWSRQIAMMVFIPQLKSLLLPIIEALILEVLSSIA